MRSEKARKALEVGACLFVSAALFCTGITWGLPSRSIDKYLFGGHPVWSGEKIHALAGDRPAEGSRGADVDATPVMRSRDPVALNASDEDRARILLRYRLYTCQPDEMITMMSLARMRPAQHDFDPRLYQYGGAWIYSIGALLAICGKLGLLHVTHDLAYYLEHPGAFARFYIVARAYSAAWALVGMLAVYAIARRLVATPPSSSPTNVLGMEGESPGRDESSRSDSSPLSRHSSRLAPLLAALAFALLPVILTTAHEAKPHLPAAVMMLLAVLAGVRFVEMGRVRWAVITGCLCGLSFGTVLAALPVFVVLPLMVLLRPMSWPSRLASLVFAAIAGSAVYLATNPYVAINFLLHRDTLMSNLQNSTAMYRIGDWSEGVRNAAYLVAEAASPVIAVVGCIATFALLALSGENWRERLLNSTRDARFALAILLATPALLVLLQFTALAAGKPGEYGRFLAYPAASLVIAAMASVHHVQPGSSRRWQVLLLAAAAVFGGRYEWAFLRDVYRPSRLEAADYLAKRPDATLLLTREPAPYNMPPFNLFTHKLLMDEEAAGSFPPEALIVRAVDHPEALAKDVGGKERIVVQPQPPPLGNTVMTWADKPIVVSRRAP